MKKLNKDQILLLHSMAIKKTGGLDGIRDSGLLESALHSPFQSFENNELYPSIQGKAARLCYSLINNHPFIDGNKRIGILTMLVFLEINNVFINCEDEDIINLGLGVASGRYDAIYIKDWIIKYSNN